MPPASRPLVLRSYENGTGRLCVDLFRREDGSFGFEEYRRDPEEAGKWTKIGSFGAERYADRDAALSAAKAAVSWLDAPSAD